MNMTLLYNIFLRSLERSFHMDIDDLIFADQELKKHSTK